MKTKAARLENWCIVEPLECDPRIPLEHRPFCLFGKAFGHPPLKDGAVIADGTALETSTIIGYDEETDEIICGGGFRYRLGTIRPEFLFWSQQVRVPPCADPKQALIACLSQQQEAGRTPFSPDGVEDAHFFLKGVDEKKGKLPEVK